MSSPLLPLYFTFYGTFFNQLGGMFMRIRFALLSVLLSLTSLSAFANSYADCLAAMPGGVLLQFAYETCEGARSAAPGRCYAAASDGHLLQSHAARLCNRAHSNAPADCYKAVSDGYTLQSTAADLCHRADSTMPAQCYKAVSDGNLLQKYAARLCNRATSLEPANCYKRLPAGIPQSVAVENCRQ